MKTVKLIIGWCLLMQAFPSWSQKMDWQYFTMNGNECRIFTSKGQSRIIIPAYCFYLEGKPYDGPIQILFKEYKNQTDFIFEELSLRYEINGTLKNLQSGGMFEIHFKTGDTKKVPLTFAPSKRVTVKFAIDPAFDVAGLEPFYFEPSTQKWIKQTRFGKTMEGNKKLSDKSSELWSDNPSIAQLNDNPEMDGDNDCYTIQIEDKRNPGQFMDTVICPSGNVLDYTYQRYISDQAFKTMQIDKMGLFNYDKIFNEENSIPMFVNLITKDGKTMVLTDKLYVVYKSSNSVIYYNASELAEKFSLIPRNDITLFIYNSDGTLAKVPDSFWRNVDIRKMKGKTLDLPFETLKLANLSKEEFASVTGLKN